MRFIKFITGKICSKRKEVYKNKSYVVDDYNFLYEYEKWDENYALFKAAELKIPGGLKEMHWKIIKFLREKFKESNEVPNIADCCKANEIERKDLEMLFPDGYQRGAVKISGLRL